MSDTPALPRAIGVSHAAQSPIKTERELIDDVQIAAKHLRVLMEAAERAGLVVQPTSKPVPIRYVEGGMLLDSPVVTVRVMKRVPLPAQGQAA